MARAMSEAVPPPPTTLEDALDLCMELRFKYRKAAACLNKGWLIIQNLESKIERCEKKNNDLNRTLEFFVGLMEEKAPETWEA